MFTLSPVNRPKGKLRIQFGPREPHDDGTFKDRAAWMLEALNVYRSHRMGWCLSPAQAEKFTALYKAGFWASWRISVHQTEPCTYSLTDGPELSLKEALKQAAEILKSAAA